MENASWDRRCAGFGEAGPGGNGTVRSRSSNGLALGRTNVIHAALRAGQRGFDFPKCGACWLSRRAGGRPLEAVVTGRAGRESGRGNG